MSKCIGGTVNDSLGDLLAYSPGKSFGNQAERSIRLLLLLLLYSLLNLIPLSAKSRFLWDGDVPLHEWTYPLSQRPDTVDDSEGWRSYQTPEPQTELTTWIFDEGTFVPSAKLVGDRRYSIISDYLGTPVEAYDEEGRRVWQRELDIYGRTRVERGEVGLVPFLYQGQYLDTETGLAYNRFRYYSPETGAYISQDPIRLEAGLTNLYAYVHDTNAWVDPWGLECDKVDNARARQHKMLQDNKGFNISPTDWDAYPSIGRNGTFITDREGALGYFANFKKGDTIRISPEKARQIEADMGLNLGSLQNGFKVREVTGISSMNPRSPLEGNEHFLGSASARRGSRNGYRFNSNNRQCIYNNNFKSYCKMKERLGDKIIVLELAGQNIQLKNSSDNFRKELIAMGFVKDREFYVLNLPPKDMARRVALIKKLLTLEALFSNGKDWSPSELVDYYKEIGLIDSQYYEISWKEKEDFHITSK